MKGLHKQHESKFMLPLVLFLRDYSALAMGECLFIPALRCLPVTTALAVDQGLADNNLDDELNNLENKIVEIMSVYDSKKATKMLDYKTGFQQIH